MHGPVECSSDHNIGGAVHHTIYGVHEPWALNPMDVYITLILTDPAVLNVSLLNR